MLPTRYGIYTEKSVAPHQFGDIDHEIPGDLAQRRSSLWWDEIWGPSTKEVLVKFEFLQGKCRKAGKAILDQEILIGGLKKDIDRLAEERDNYRTMLLKDEK